MIGTNAAPDYDQSKACLGHFDMISLVHKGDHPGYEVYGWAWDVDAAAPAARVIIADSTGRIVGAGEGGVNRPDVPKVLPKVTSVATGWRGLVAARGGKVTALAVLKSGKQCDAGSLQLPGD